MPCAVTPNAVAWPPVPTADGLMVPPGILGTLRAIERTYGSHQMTSNHLPRSSFTQDAAQGDTTGQDVGDIWSIVNPGMPFSDVPHNAEAGHDAGEEAGSATPASS